MPSVPLNSPRSAGDRALHHVRARARVVGGDEHLGGASAGTARPAAAAESSRRSRDQDRHDSRKIGRSTKKATKPGRAGLLFGALGTGRGQRLSMRATRRFRRLVQSLHVAADTRSASVVRRCCRATQRRAGNWRILLLARQRFSALLGRQRYAPSRDPRAARSRVPSSYSSRPPTIARAGSPRARLRRGAGAELGEKAAPAKRAGGEGDVSSSRPALAVNPAMSEPDAHHEIASDANSSAYAMPRAGGGSRDHALGRSRAAGSRSAPRSHKPCGPNTSASSVIALVSSA